MIGRGGAAGFDNGDSRANIVLTTGQDAGLRPLGDYGGPTKTHALLANSPAVDKGSNTRAIYNSVALLVDQRGYNRVVYRNAATPNVDIGAYELGLVVSTNDDASDSDLSDGHLSLREAVVLAGQITGNNQIEFDQSLAGAVIGLVQGEMMINSPIEIVGLGMDALTIDGRDLSRVFRINTGVAATIRDLTITGGRSDGGGGVYTFGNLTMDSVRVEGNTSSGPGGGIFVYGQLTLSSSIIDQNESTTAKGGGIFVNDSATATITDTTVDNNKAVFGGGISGYFASGNQLFIDRSTISHNRAWAGGGLFLQNATTNAAGAWVVSSTVSSNTANYSGGIRLDQSGLRLNLVNSTVAFNTGDESGGIQLTSGATARTHNSIIAENKNAAGTIDSDLLYGSLDQLSSYNLIGRAGAASGLSNGGTYQNRLLTPTESAGLAPLGDYGGITKTHALLPTSFAVDAGSNIQVVFNALVTDQRGFARVVDDGVVVGPTGQTVDIGAFELGQVITKSADFDGNGYKDYAAYDPLTRTIVAFLGAAQATTQVAIAKLDSGSEWENFQIGDFNGDHRDDVWFRQRGTNKWSIAVSDGSQFNVSDPADAVSTSAWGATFKGDFDGDGAQELLGWNGLSGAAGQWEVLDYDDHGGVKLQPSWGQPLSTGAQPLQIGDVNQDGRDDLFRYDSTNGWQVAMSETQWNGASIFVAKPGNWHPWFDNFDVNSSGIFTVDADVPYKKLLEIFSYVYNTIDVEFYPGLMKGPTATEETKAGNAWDQAALLLQLLDAAGFEAAGINAGTVRATEDETLAWLGAKDVTAALGILQSAIDDSAAYNPTAHTFTFRSAWVTMPAPVATGLDWIILDPSWKFRNFQPGVALGPGGGSGLLNSFDTFAKQFLFTKEDGKFVKSQLPIEAYEAQAMNYLVTTPTLQRKSLADVPYDGPIIQQQFKQIPATNKQHPSPPSFSDGVGYYWDVDDSWTPDVEEFYTNPSRSAQWTHRLSIKINGSSEQIISVPQNSLDEISIWYSNGTTGMVVPHLSVGSQTLLTMSQVPTGSDVTIVVKHLDPTKYQALLGSFYQHTDTYVRKAGQIVVVSLEANQYSSGRIAQMQADLTNELATVGSGYTAAMDKDDIDDVLRYIGAKYWFNFNRDLSTLSGLTQTIDAQPRVGSGLVTSDATFAIQPHLDFPLVPDGANVDLRNWVVNPIALKSSGNSAGLEVFRLALFNASALENAILEEVINAESISTIKGIQLYLDKGQTTPSTNETVIVFERNPDDSAFNPGGLPRYRRTASADDNGFLDNLSELWTESSLRSFLVTLPTTVVNDVVSKLNAPNALNRIWIPIERVGIPASATAPGWNGTVYIYESIGPTTSLSYLIQQDGAPGNGGYRVGEVLPPKLTLPIGTSTNQTTVGDPVSVANGNMSRDEVDFRFSNGNLPLDFARHYDSQNPMGVGFGIGWTHSFTGILYSDPAEWNKITWLRGDGTRHTFELLSNGTWKVPASLYGSFEGPGSANGNRYRFLDKDGTQYLFELVTPFRLSGISNDDPSAPDYDVQIKARLTEIKYRGSDTDKLVITYLAGESNRVERVTGALTNLRKVEFVYDDAHGLVMVKKVENGTAVATWTYQIDDNFPTNDNPASWPGYTNRRLIKVTSPTDQQYLTTPVETRYEYYNDGPLARLGLIKKIIEPDESYHKYEYYANGRVFRVTDSAGRQQTYNYNLYRNLTEATDERGNVETYIFQDNGLTTKQIHPDRSRLEFTWGATTSPEEFLMTSSTDEIGAKETFSYVPSTDSNYHPGDLKQSIAKDGLVTNYEYAVISGAYVSRLGKVIVDPDQSTGSKITTQYTYDSVGNLLKVTDAESHPTEYAYYGASDTAAWRGLRKSETLPNGDQTVYEYDTAGNLYKAITNNLPTTERTYDTFGNIKTELDATGVKTFNTYDALGRLTKTVVNSLQNADPVGVSTTAISYDPWRVKSTTDALGHVTANQYDANGRIIKQTFADGTFTKRAYDEVGNCIAATDELGHTTRFVYDSRNRVIQTIYADGTSSRTRYDGAGRVVESTDEKGHSAEFKYDRNGRLLETAQLLEYPGTTTTAVVSTNQYDHLGNLVKVTDSNRNVTVNQFDKLGRITETRAVDNTNFSLPPVLLTTTSYDSNGQITSQVTYDGPQLAAQGFAIPSKYANPPINFESQQLYKFEGTNTTPTLDTSGSPHSEDAGRRLYMDGNSRKAIDLNYTITPNTVLEFDFQELVPGELFGIGIVNNINSALTKAYKLGGSENVDSNPAWSSVSPAYTAGGKSHYKISLGANVAGNYSFLVFVNSDRGVVGNSTPGQGKSTFSNVRMYEDIVETNTLASLATANPDDVQIIDTKYDAFGRPVQVTNADGTTTSTTYDAAGRVLSTIDELGHKTEYKYDQFGRLERTIAPDPDGIGAQVSSYTRYERDRAGNVVKQWNFFGKDGLANVEFADSFTYDVRNRLATTTRKDGTRVDSVLNPVGQVVASIDALGNSAYSVYDERGRIVEQRLADPDGSGSQFAPVTKHEYDEAGNVEATIDARGNKTKFEYDSLNRLRKESHDETIVVDDSDILGDYTFTVDSGQRAPQVDPTAYGVGRTWVAGPATNSPQATWKFNNLEAGTYQVSISSVSLSSWDGAAVEIPGKGVSRPVVQLRQSPKFTTVHGDREIGWNWVADVTVTNGENLLVQLKLNDGIILADTVRLDRLVSNLRTYDKNGNVLTETDTHGNVTTYFYDELNRLVQTQSADPDGSSTALRSLVTDRAYDGYGNLQSETHGYKDTPPAITYTSFRTDTFKYDQRNRLLKQTLDSGVSVTGGAQYENIVTTYEYDAAGNRVTVTDPLGYRTHYRYDTLNRVIDQYEDYGNREQTVTRIIPTAVDAYPSGDGDRGVASDTPVIQNGSVTIGGNAWKSMQVNNFFVTKNTVLEFSVESDWNAEFVGIGLDTDNTFNLAPTEQLYVLGGESLPLAYFGNYDYLRTDRPDGTVTFHIPIGAYLSAADQASGRLFSRLVFTNVDGRSGLSLLERGQTTFSNIKLYEEFGVTPTSGTLANYGLDGDRGVASDMPVVQNRSVTIGGNAWKSLPVSYTVKYNTVLEFEVQSDWQAELVGIMLDTDNNFNVGAPPEQLYVLGGQNPPTTWGNPNLQFLRDDRPAGKVTVHIPIGQYLSASDKAAGLAIAKLVLFNADGRPNLAYRGHATFSNIRLYESDEVRTVTTYDARGNVETVRAASDPRNITTRYEYDKLGRQTKKILDDGGSMEREYGTVYDATGNVLVERSPSGPTDGLGAVLGAPGSVETVHEYDRLGRLLKTTLPDPDGLESTPNGLVTTFAYDVASNLIRQTNGEGETTRTEYDAQGRTITETDGNGDETRYRYDSEGNLTTIIDAEQNKTTYTYDKLNRQTTEKITALVNGQAQPLARTNTYDLQGNLDSITDRNGRVRLFDFDALGRRRLEGWQNTAGGPIIHSLSWDYDDLNRVTKETDSGPSTNLSDHTDDLVGTFAYDGLGRLIEERNYDPAVSGGGTSQPQVRETSDYGFIDLLGSFYGGVTRDQYLHGAAGDIGVAKEVSYSDALGRLQYLTDQDNSLGSSSPQVPGTSFSFGYDATSNLTTLSRGLVSSTYAYDKANRLTSINHDVNGDYAIDHHYAYDNASRIASFNTTGANGAARGFGYDDAGQLLSKTGGTAESYAYDDNGNRVSAGGQSVVTSLGNRITDDGTYTYDYDKEGNVVKRTTKSDPARTTEYTWDQRNRLVEVRDKDGSGVTQLINYTYDAEDRRVQRTYWPDNLELQNTTTQYFVYDGNGVSLRFDDSQKLSHRYLYGPGTDQVLVDEVFKTVGAQQVTGDVLWQLADHEGTIRDIVDGNGTLRKHTDYNSFGAIGQQLWYDADGEGIYGIHAQGDPEAVDQLFAYTGQEWDKDAKLYNYNARWYDPYMGRFLSEDPAHDGENPYEYVGDDPINKKDPTGWFQTGNPVQSVWQSLGNSNTPLITGGPPQVNQTLVNNYRTEVARYEASRDAINSQLSATRDSLANRSWYEWYDSGSDRNQISQLNDNLQSTFGHLRAAQENLRGSLAGTVEPVSVFHPSTGTVSVSGAFGSGLQTGFKAVSNASASSLSLGFYEGPFGITQQDIDNGYYTSRAIAGVGTEILVGVGTGGLATYTRAGSAARVIGKTALAFDTAKNTLGVGRGVSDAYQNGLGFGNSLQIVGSGLGLAGNITAGGQALREITSDASRLVSVPPTAVGRINGNSLASPRTAYLYRLEDAEGNFLKWGVTQDMAKRYPQSYMADKLMEEVARGTRADMIRMERGFVETQPGPLNFERWAGSRSGEQP